MTLTIMGEVEAGRALRRDGARPGDDIWVSGYLGGAALALGHLQGSKPWDGPFDAAAMERLHRPDPRVALGESLQGVATAAIDVSDGLVADLQHICERSSLGAQIEWPRVPLHPSLRAINPDRQMACALTGGDDYELCFTAPASAAAAIGRIAGDLRVPLTRIGNMQAGAPVVTVLDARGAVLPLAAPGYDHFTQK
jgi:thiamine-monophosphate kinase